MVELGTGDVQETTFKEDVKTLAWLEGVRNVGTKEEGKSREHLSQPGYLANGHLNSVYVHMCGWV